MKRRDFLKTTGQASLGAMAAPYILPSGRLFAPTGARIANHVVFVLFAGGIRNQESVDQYYLASQGAGPTGNVMRNMLNGAPPSSDLVYSPWTPAVSSAVQNNGTLLRNMRYAQGPTGHYNGHTVAMTGHYTNTSLNLNINPENPTIFEYYRKHSDPSKSAINCWWMSTELGPYPSLNYSRHHNYGPEFGANYFMPAYAGGSLGYEYYGTLAALHPEERTRVADVRTFLDGNFDKEPWDLPGIRNTEEDRARIQDLYLNTLNGSDPLDIPVPPGVPGYNLTGDGQNIANAWKVMEAFHPELMVVNTTNVDVCHDNFSLYLDFLHRADYAIGWLWNKIQSDPVLANDTVLICMPEHGRNLLPNTLVDANGLRAFDHTEDSNSRDIFGLFAGPSDKMVQGQTLGTEDAPVGEAIDIVPTIAHILGFHDQIPPGMLAGRVLNELFL